jgi:hypothetical protein
MQEDTGGHLFQNEWKVDGSGLDGATSPDWQGRL